MKSLLYLPRCYLVGHVIPFLDLKNIVQLDCALSNRILRANLHVLLSGVRLLGNINVQLSCAAVKWIFRRQLKLENGCFDVHEKNARWGEASQLFQSTICAHITSSDHDGRNEYTRTDADEARSYY